MNASGATPRAEAAARWLLSLPAEESAAVVERLSRETLEEIRAALARLGEPAAPKEIDVDEDALDAEPPFLLAALLAASPAGERDRIRATLAARRGTEVLAAIDGFGPLSPTPVAADALRRGGKAAP